MSTQEIRDKYAIELVRKHGYVEAIEYSEKMLDEAKTLSDREYWEETQKSIEEGVWINRKKDTLICALCGCEMKVESEDIEAVDELVQIFFDEHLRCGLKNKEAESTIPEMRKYEV